MVRTENPIAVYLVRFDFAFFFVYVEEDARPRGMDQEWFHRGFCSASFETRDNGIGALDVVGMG